MSKIRTATVKLNDRGEEMVCMAIDDKLSIGYTYCPMTKRYHVAKTIRSDSDEYDFDAAVSVLRSRLVHMVVEDRLNEVEKRLRIFDNFLKSKKVKRILLKIKE